MAEEPPRGSYAILEVCMYSLKKNVILHPYLPITATSSKVAIIERFDCNILV